MNNNLNYGGHLSAQPYGALFNHAESNPQPIQVISFDGNRFDGSTDFAVFNKFIGTS